MPLTGRDPAGHGSKNLRSYFYSHVSCGAMQKCTEKRRKATNSTHTPLARHDNGKLAVVIVPFDFYSHASCEARHTGKLLGNVDFIISTHTPLARRDQTCEIANAIHADFYSHASCEARRKSFLIRIRMILFLLTRPMRGATLLTLTYQDAPTISTHTPHAGRDKHKRKSYSSS